MDKKIRYTLGKDERLKSRKAIDQLFKEGRSFSIFPFRVLYALQQHQPPVDGDVMESGLHGKIQAGFTASSRHFKKAVDRNRIKRLMREAYRLQKNELQLLTEVKKNTLTIFLIYVGKELPEYKLVYEKMAVVLNRLIKFASESR